MHTSTQLAEQGADEEDVGLLADRLADDARGKNEYD